MLLVCVSLPSRKGPLSCWARAHGCRIRREIQGIKLAKAREELIETSWKAMVQMVRNAIALEATGDEQGKAVAKTIRASVSEMMNIHASIDAQQDSTALTY